MYTVSPDPSAAAAEARLYADCSCDGPYPDGVAAGLAAIAEAGL
jgi:hypothetical protein